MRDGQRFSFTERIDNLGRSVIMPYLPLTLSSGNYSVEVTALYHWITSEGVAENFRD